MYNIVAADIGGTNCRMALFDIENGELVLKSNLWRSTVEIPHTEALENALEEALNVSLDRADAFVAAIAGPVEEETKGRLSNGEMALDFTERKNKKSLRVALINDFMAQAYAVISPEGSRARKLSGREEAPELATRAVLGAGTGLGYATIARIQGLPYGGHWHPMPSENGWSAFPFQGPQENKFHDFICKELKLPFATGDDVLSGRGLAALHKFLTGDALQPYQIGPKYLAGETETSIWYSRFLGRVCRNWILATLCYGGLWIAGGIAAQNPYTVRNCHFLKELYGHPRWDELLRSVPVYLIEDKNSGLWGAARLGQEMLFQGKIEDTSMGGGPLE